jgi:hypothetical protein
VWEPEDDVIEEWRVKIAEYDPRKAVDTVCKGIDNPNERVTTLARSECHSRSNPTYETACSRERREAGQAALKSNR